MPFTVSGNVNPPTSNVTWDLASQSFTFDQTYLMYDANVTTNITLTADLTEPPGATETSTTTTYQKELDFGQYSCPTRG